MKLIKKLFIVFILFLNLLFAVKKVMAQEHLWAGANQYQLWYQRFGRIQQQLNALQDAHLKVLRIFLGHRDQYLSWEDPPEAYTFENPVGTFHDENLEKVDYLMSECQKRGIKLIIALSTHSQPYLDKYGPIEIYRSSASINDHKNRFTHFLDHFNSYLGKAWKDCDDVVYAWEIQNEAGIPLLDVASLTTQERHDVIRNFLTELADHIKSVDPNTRVSLGIAGYALYYHNGRSGDDIRTLGNIQAADIYTLHFYGGNLTQWIRENLTYCRSIGKLLFVEEFGNERNVGMSELINLYRDVCQTCRQEGVPWMFWRLGHRKDANTFSINSDDSVWQQIIVPETELINQTVTQDSWGVNPSTGIHQIDFSEMPQNFISCYPNPFNTQIHFTIYTISSEVYFTIFNTEGQEIFSKKYISNQNILRLTWDGTDKSGNVISSGLYFVVVQDRQNRKLTEKIIFIK